jgi:hypothetical protein
MKTTVNYMKWFLMVIVLTSITGNGNSQETKLTRQEQKELKQARRTADFFVLDSLVNSKRFVLEADFLQDTHGERVPVVNTLNFVRVDRSDGVLQTGSNYGMGYNGVGGVTATGTVSQWKLEKDSRKLTLTLRFGLLTNLGNYDILMYVSSDNHARATITGLGPGNLTWEGHLKTLNSSGVYKGQDAF